MMKDNEYRLGLGETAKVRRGIVRADISVAYTGSPSPDRYSIALIFIHGNLAYSYNLYFSSNQREIALPKGKIRISKISPEEIYFQFFDKNE